MWCPESLKVNKFKEVAIPTPTEYVQRYGLRAAPDSYTGEELAVPAMSKIQQLNVADFFNSRALQHESQESRLAAQKAAETSPISTDAPDAAN